MALVPLATDQARAREQLRVPHTHTCFPPTPLRARTRHTHTERAPPPGRRTHEDGEVAGRNSPQSYRQTRRRRGTAARNKQRGDARSVGHLAVRIVVRVVPTIVLRVVLTRPEHEARGHQRLLLLARSARARRGPFGQAAAGNRALRKVLLDAARNASSKRLWTPSVAKPWIDAEPIVDVRRPRCVAAGGGARRAEGEHRGRR